MSTEFHIPKEQQSRFDSQKAIDNRQIRIFLSSTFSDMQKERDALIKTFNSLKVEANKRNVTLSVVDLRWGVTEEEARTGKVISVCLNEIEHSHPFFIGMLGSRYGYAPDLSELHKNPELKERYPWIEKAIEEQLSITEMEMLYGALCNDSIKDAVFYFRQSDTPDDSPKLTALKNKIRTQQRFPHDDYANADELCEKVEKAVLQMLDNHFPVTEATALDRERTAQKAYINSRHGQYLRRQADFDRINAFVASDERNLVVTGQSGMGKSALLANWIKENADNEKYNLVYHFVGNSLSASNSYANVLRHLCDEIYDLYGISQCDDSNDKKIEDEAKNAFMEVCNHEKPLVIVIDGIDQVLEIYNEKQLTWLPDANRNLKYIFTTLPDNETMRVFERRDYHIITLQPMTIAMRKQFATSYLENVGKHLTEAQWERIFSDKENENTLVLKTLLDELICFGTHEKIDERIDYYLNAKSIPEFYDRVLQRMENDYSNGQKLVGHTLALLALSEKGLSEDELLAITGYRQIDWNLFHCAVYNHLVEKEGLITFSHQYILKAVNQRYLSDDDTPLRDEIINYFEQIELNDYTIYWQRTKRTIPELAFQYYMKKDWDGLYKTLMSVYGFRCFHESNEYVLAAYWRTLRRVNAEKYSMNGYLNLEYRDLDGAPLLHDMAKFVSDYFEDHDLVPKLAEKALEYNPKVGDKVMIYNILAGYNKSNALPYLQKACEYAEKTGNGILLGGTYINLGAYYTESKKYDKSLRTKLTPTSVLLEKAEKYIQKGLDITIQATGPEHPRVAVGYLYLGSLIYMPRKEYEKALDCFLKTRDIQLKTQGEYARTLHNTYMFLGAAYLALHKYDKALAYFEKGYQLMVKIYGEDDVQTIQLKKVYAEYRENIIKLMNKMNKN